MDVQNAIINRTNERTERADGGWALFERRISLIDIDAKPEMDAFFFDMYE